MIGPDTPRLTAIVDDELERLEVTPEELAAHRHANELERLEMPEMHAAMERLLSLEVGAVDAEMIVRASLRWGFRRYREIEDDDDELVGLGRGVGPPTGQNQ